MLLHTPPPTSHLASVVRTPAPTAPQRARQIDSHQLLAGTALVVQWTRTAPRLRALRTRQLSTPGQVLALQLAYEEACQLER
jgi:hypothetical protein